MDLTGLLAAVGVLAAASAFGLWRKQTNGVLRETGAVRAGAAAERLAAADLGIELGARATLVQLSSKACQYCGPTRRVLGEIADKYAVAYIDIDAEERLDLARRLNVLRTPTVLLLDADGRITHRVSGAPRRAELAAAVGALAGTHSG